MGNIFLYDANGHLKIGDSGKVPELVPFPVCLAVKNGTEVGEMCADFVLNLKKSLIFIRTESPLPAGTSITMHFYIPPEAKLLAEVRGKVMPIAGHRMQLPRGMLVRFAWHSRLRLKYLERYATGERHLVDMAA